MTGGLENADGHCISLEGESRTKMPMQRFFFLSLKALARTNTVAWEQHKCRTKP